MSTTDGDTDTEDTKRVSTYVPSEQKSEWAAHADDLNMSQSEFIRTMVQAGRRNFTTTPTDTDTDSDSDATLPGGDSLEQTVLALLDTNDAMEWDELLTAVTESVEGDLEAVLDRLQDENQVRYSGRNGGYSVKSNE